MTTYLSNYQTFQSKIELNEAISSHLNYNRYNLNETDRDVFLMLSRYSIKYYGASHLKVSTIANSINKSNRTVQRSLSKLSTLKMIQKESFIRKVSGGFGANLYLILPFVVISDCRLEGETTSPYTTTPQATKTENEPFSFKSKYLKDIKTYPQESYNVHQSFYSHFKSSIESMLGTGSQSLISKLYGVYKAQSIPMLKFDIYSDKKSLFESLATKAIKITLQASKKKHIKNLAGFFSRVYLNLILKHVIGVDDSLKPSKENINWYIPHR